MERIEIICDQCGARKGDTNHWWRGGITNVGFHIYPINYNTEESDYDLGIRNDFCSESCVSKALSEFLARKTKELNRIMAEELTRDPTLVIDRDDAPSN